MKTQDHTSTISQEYATYWQIITDTTEDPINGPRFYLCDRGEEISLDLQVRVPLGISQPIGITCPVFLTYMADAAHVQVGLDDQDKETRLRELLTAVNAEIRIATPDKLWLSTCYFPRGWKNAKPATLHIAVGPLDIDNPQPSITVMLPYEDYGLWRPFGTKEA